MRNIALAAALGALIATPVLADKGRSDAASRNEAAPAGQPAPAAKPERKTCRTFANTVSRTKSERLCLTREQWEKFDETQQ